MSWLDTIEGLYKHRDFGELPPEQRDKAARDVINLSAFGSCALVAAPLPLSELLLTTPVHVAMVVGVGKVYGRKLDREQAQALFVELAATAGASVAARSLWIALSKVIAPGIGAFLFVPYVYAVTWGLGRLAMAYFEDPDADRETLKKKYEEFVAEGKKGFSFSKFKDFMKKQGGEVQDFDAKEGSTAAGTAPPVESEAVESEAVEASWDDEDLGSAKPMKKAAEKATKKPAKKTAKTAAKKTAKKATKKAAKKPAKKVAKKPAKASPKTTAKPKRSAAGKQGSGRSR